VSRRASKPKPKFVTRDGDIRSVLLGDLGKKYPDSDHDLILEEFGCNSARIDVAVINGALHGYEIKSDSDTTDRLEAQIYAYCGVFDFITVVCGKRLESSIRAKNPQTCGITLATCSDGAVSLREIRKPRKNPSQRNLDLARMMWRSEALRCLRIHGYTHINSRNHAEEIWQAAAECLSVEVLSEAARLAIKARGGSGFVKQPLRDDGSNTIESIALLDHCSANLAWLLSTLTFDRPG
jgi:hypothetical protein